MNKFKTLFGQPEFLLLVFFLGLVLFTQPLLTMTNMKSPTTVLLALFLPWAIIILLLLSVGQSLSVSPSHEGDPQEQPPDEQSMDDHTNGEMTDV